MENNLLLLLEHYKYLLLFPLAIIEGPFIMMISGFLLKLGYLSLLPTCIVLMAGDFLGDLGWYALGYFWGWPLVRKFGKFLGITEETIKIASKIFSGYKSIILFFSKITMGFGFALATLISAGIVKVPLKRFAVMNIAGQVIWTAMLLSVGYFFGTWYQSVDNWLSRLSAIAFLIIAFIALLNFMNYLRRRFFYKAL